MNMREDEHNKEDIISPHILEHDSFVQLPTSSPPRLNISEKLSLDHAEKDSRVTDEVPTLVLPVAPSARDRWWSSLSIDEMTTWILPAVRPDSAADTATESDKTIVDGLEGHLAPILNLIKSSGIYAVSSVAPPLVVLVLAPFLTHTLSPSDYGILTVLNAFIGLGSGITQLGLASAFFRAYGYDYTSQRDQRDILATVNTLLCLVSIPTIIGMAITAPSLATLLFGRSSLGNLIALAGGVILLQNFTVPGYAWLRAEHRALFFSLLAISNVLVMLIANIILVGVMHLGVAGSLIGTGCGYASVIICMMPITLLRAGIKIRADIARSLLTFGLPLVLNFVSYWVLQLSDRYLLDLLGSLAQTARYAVAYTLGSGMSVLVMGPFSLAWPITMFAIAKREDAAQTFRVLFRWFSIFLLFAAFGLSLVGTILLNWLFPVTYHSTIFIIPVISGSYAFYGVYYVFTAGVNIKRKTWMISIFTTVAAVVNVTLNLILIPLYGAMGAAVSTLLAYIVLAMMAYVVNQRIYPISFEIGKFIIALLIGVALYIGISVWAQSWGAYIAWGISFGTLCLYSGFLMLLGGFPAWSHKVE